jgi:hypothetical protein
MHHVYLYESSPGTPALDLSTTAPVLYHGSARHMNGDTGRRYLGSVVPNGATTPAMHRFQSDGRFYRYLIAHDAAPLPIFTGVSNTTWSVSSLAHVVAPSSIYASVLIRALGTQSFFYNVPSAVTVGTTTGAFIGFIDDEDEWEVTIPLDDAESANPQSMARRHQASGGSSNMYLLGYYESR